MHCFLATCPNAIPPVVTTGVGHKGQHVVHYQLLDAGTGSNVPPEQPPVSASGAAAEAPAANKENIAPSATPSDGHHGPHELSFSVTLESVKKAKVSIQCVQKCSFEEQLADATEYVTFFGCFSTTDILLELAFAMLSNVLLQLKSLNKSISSSIRWRTLPRNMSKFMTSFAQSCTVLVKPANTLMSWMLIRNPCRNPCKPWSPLQRWLKFAHPYLYASLHLQLVVLTSLHLLFTHSKIVTRIR